MNKNIFVAFLAGAAIGAASAFYYAKAYYERIAQEEIDSVKEVFSNKAKKNDDLPDDANSTTSHNEQEETRNDFIKYATKLSDEGYTNYSNSNNTSSNKETENAVTEDRPYVISPDEFGEGDEYDIISLTYYADGVLTDDMDELVDDVEGTVGQESLSHFGEYEDDSVFVRNDKLKTDYEILRDDRDYSDILESKPYLRGTL